MASPEEIEESKALFTELLTLAPGLKELPSKAIRELIGFVIKETTATNRSLEQRIDAAGAIPPDIMGVLFHYGALAAVVEDLPPDEPRRQLVDAGRAIGRYITKRYGKTIAKKLSNPQ